MDGLQKLVVIGMVILIGIAVFGFVLAAGAIAAAVAAFFASGAKRITLILVALSLGTVAILWNSEVFGGGKSKRLQTKGYTSLMKAVHKKDVKKVKKLSQKEAR